MYIAALRIADDFGCAGIGIQYQQGLKDLVPASDLAEGLLNEIDRPPAYTEDGRELYPGQPLPHFNEVDWSYQSNNFGEGLPPAPDNQDKWPEMAPLLADPAIAADAERLVDDRIQDLEHELDLEPLVARVHEAGAMAIVACDLLASVLFRPPGEAGADECHAPRCALGRRPVA